MSIKRLLTTTAAFAALAPGLAHAAVGLIPSASGHGGTELVTDYDLAQEASLVGTALNTHVGLRIAIAGLFPPGQNILITLNVQGGTFTSALTGAGENGVGATGMTVNSGGASGGSTVRYLATADPGATAGTPAGFGDSIGLRLPITFAGCPSTLSFTVTELTTESGTVIEGGTATLKNNNTGTDPTNYVIRCIDGIKASLVPDYLATGVGGVGVDSKLTLPTFATFVANAAATGPFNDDLLGGLDADIGFFTAALGTAATGNTIVKTIVSTGPAPVVPADVTGFTTTTNATGLNLLNTEATPIAGPGLFTAGPTAFASGASALNGVTPAGAFPSNGILIMRLAAGAHTPQQPTITNCAIKLGGGFVATDPCLMVTVDDLDEDGLLVGPFDWVGDFSRPTQNVFRITGIGSAVPTIRVRIANASGGASFNGTYPMAGLAITNGDLIINSQQITNAVGGNFGRADVSFLIVKDIVTSPGLDNFDVDRLMSTGGIVSSFGNNEVGADNVDRDDN